MMLAKETQEQPAPYRFSPTWHILGPFHIGTREASWGADYLESIGGFRNLEYDGDARFPSSIAPNGTVQWNSITATSLTESASGAIVTHRVTFPNIDWAFMRTVYGWASVQYQAWIRGEIIVQRSETQPFVLYSDQILEFWVDDVHYFGGDLYVFRKAPPVLHLGPGRHRLDVRLVRDVRAMGGVDEPSIDIKFEIKPSTGRLELAKEGIVISDLVDGILASDVAAVAVRNSGTKPVKIFGIEDRENSLSATLRSPDMLVLPGQTRPVMFHISPSISLLSLCVRLSLRYTVLDAAPQSFSLEVNQTLRSCLIHEPHKVTFIHPSNIVSYAILRAPPKNVSSDGDLPILLQLHGAGLEADSYQVAHALDAVSGINSWVLFPTGVTPWSGDDWHVWGFADVEAAVSAIPAWIKSVGWRGPGLDAEKWLVSGHSNGGQGTWYALTHWPDKVVAAAPVSGYSSMQNYVPYHLWKPADPQRAAIIQASLNNYKHELLISNAKYIPIVQQHGSADGNVPAFHSRLMHECLEMSQWHSNYYELADAGHWFDGVMTTPQLREFYRMRIAELTTSQREDREFTLTVANPATMGSKEGFKVTRLQDSGQLGKLQVKISCKAGHVKVRTSNILSFVMTLSSFPRTAEVDGQKIPEGHGAFMGGTVREVIKSAEGQWKVQTEGPIALGEISPPQQAGALDSFLKSNGAFTISYSSPQLFSKAVQISRNLYQYFSADSEIVEAANVAVRGSSGNIVSLCEGGNLSKARVTEFPIAIKDTGAISIRDDKGDQRVYDEDGLAAIFLRPSKDEALELVVWGRKVEDVDLAARLVPMITGVGQPAFVVLRKEALWKGIEGVLAMGFFNHLWNVTRTSFFA